MKTVKFLLLPIFTYCLFIWTIINIKTWNYQTELSKKIFTNTSFVKLMLTILLPIILILTIKKLKLNSGIYFGQKKNSFLIAWTSFRLIGPACIGFLIIGLLGWSFKDWYGSIVLATIFTIALCFIPKLTQKLITQNESEKKRLKPAVILLILSVITTLVSIFVKNINPIFFKAMYFIFIVAVGEELFFRGYIQSSFNLFFGKKFQIGTVKLGWALPFSAILFGLSHSLVTNPITWPWMLFTFVGGLILGFIREKDGSLLAPIVLHALMDFPLIFMT